jgi:hypothetical protein
VVNSLNVGRVSLTKSIWSTMKKTKKPRRIPY